LPKGLKKSTKFVDDFEPVLLITNKLTVIFRLKNFYFFLYLFSSCRERFWRASFAFRLAGRRLWLMVDGAESDLSSSQVLLRVTGPDGLDDDGVRDASDEIADVLVTDKRRHGAEVRLTSRPFGRILALVLVQFSAFFVVGVSPGVDAARDGAVAAGPVKLIRIGGAGSGLVEIGLFCVAI